MGYSAYTLDNPSAYLGKTQWPPPPPPSDICVENVYFDNFNWYVCTGEHFQSDLDIFGFDFMFVKPRDMPQKFCFNMQIDMRVL